MNINFLPLLFILFVIFSCQTAKQVEDADESQAEQLAQRLAQQKKDSLQLVFCDCLVDSLTNEQRLKKIDVLLSQNIDINIPCDFEEEEFSSSAGTALLNAGISISNRVLRTNFRKRSSKSRTVTKTYPVLMLFNEDTAMVREFVNRGASLDVKTSDMPSLPSHYASQNDFEKLKFTLALGADAEKIDVYTNNEKMIDFLLEKGAKTENIDKTSLCKDDNYERLAKKYNADFSKTTCKEFKNIVEVTNFRRINFERTEWLLKNGAKPSCIDGRFLESILDEDFDSKIYSSNKKQKPNQHTKNEWVEMVSKYDVNWNQCTTFGKTPLLLSIEKHDIDLIKILLKEGADPNFACEFAGQKRTVQDALEKTIQYAEENEQRKKEQEGNKYSQKDAAKHAAYLQKLDEIKKLLTSN